MGGLYTRTGASRPPEVREGGSPAAESATSLPRFTASLTTQAERKAVMSSANDADDVVNNDKRKSLSTAILS